MVKIAGRTRAAGALDILLETGKILLRGGKISRLQIGCQLVESLLDGAGGGGSGSCGGGSGCLRESLLQRGEIGLRRCDIAGLQSLSKLLEAKFTIGNGAAELDTLCSIGDGAAEWDTLFSGGGGAAKLKVTEAA